MSMSASKFGRLHESCGEAQAMRDAMPEGSIQSDWWLVCPRGDWMFWQLKKSGQNKTTGARAALEVIVTRAVRRVIPSLRGVRSPEAIELRRWARRWLSGEDRTVKSAESAAKFATESAFESSAWSAWSAASAWSAWSAASAAYAAESARCAAESARFAAWSAESAESARSAACYAARSAELRLQADEIRREIPEWDERWEGTK